MERLVLKGVGQYRIRLILHFNIQGPVLPSMLVLVGIVAAPEVMHVFDWLQPPGVGPQKGWRAG